MAEYFEITGGKKLKGTIEVRGSKNAATPILAAALLTSQKCVISNLPLIEDVFRMIEIIKGLGAEVRWLGKRKVSIKAKNIDPKKLDLIAVKKMRSSILLLGALSARCDNFKISYPGGCVIGARPVDTHIDALLKMGVKVESTECYFNVDAKKRRAAEITLKEFSVTGTENAMMLAAALPGKTVIKIAAAEPHVEDLGRFLIKMGAKIKGLGTHILEIVGSKNLKGASYEIISDANEAATFLILGVAAKSPITVKNAKINHLDLVVEKLREFGADFEINRDSIKIIPPKIIKAVAKVDTRPYPGIPTDAQAPFGALATQAKGETLIHDSLYEGRFNYVKELQKMGAKAKVLDVHRVLIQGPAKLKGRTIKSYDLRAGATVIIAALLAKGKTIIEDIHQVDRGYERLEERLQKLGANIKRIKE
ncbi:MAG: UDP-N-acetylglucosamine 1-carboxyvinyltransferase [Candidatus Moranbacteria bacterium RIFCSPHIGHO2_02_FULL_40_12b]|nr:MAG: UDP-N-acetylglucosamine 1-carboxyvinyltransferase [Candidatus Moranbacteria bacterium RIFCSPHIGHO2_02_FULL_40_12b]OGI24011.1 MAG: UDP-N-acetylglucosamine 1-carboxyvinyltransferase [Candidatus Moranbacteria bacterium RIFCSPHIGHO2_12_FULL_40_10]